MGGQVFVSSSLGSEIRFWDGRFFARFSIATLVTSFIMFPVPELAGTAGRLLVPGSQVVFTLLSSYRYDMHINLNFLWMTWKWRRSSLSDTLESGRPVRLLVFPADTSEVTHIIKIEVHSSPSKFILGSRSDVDMTKALLAIEF